LRQQPLGLLGAYITLIYVVRRAAWIFADRFRAPHTQGGRRHGAVTAASGLAESFMSFSWTSSAGWVGEASGSQAQIADRRYLPIGEAARGRLGISCSVAAGLMRAFSIVGMLRTELWMRVPSILRRSRGSCGRHDAVCDRVRRGSQETYAIDPTTRSRSPDEPNSAIQRMGAIMTSEATAIRGLRDGPVTANM